MTLVSVWHSCGRPTKTDKPCGQRRSKQAPACNRHLSEEERAEFAARQQHLINTLAAGALPAIPTRPACWSWLVSHLDRQRQSLEHWQAGRCALCGQAHQVLDHDHVTGWIRGYLCRGCNISEGSNAGRVFQRYRKWNPARILGIWEFYNSPFSGQDRGQLHGYQAARPLVVDAGGAVHFLAPWIDNVPPGMGLPQPARHADLTATLAARLSKAATGIDRQS